MPKKDIVMSLDKFGRLRLPVAFRRTIERPGKDEVFVTSTDDKNVLIYRLATWYKVADNMRKKQNEDPLLRKFLLKANYSGQIATIDEFGRIQIPGLLRKKINLEGEIAIEEREDHLELKPT